MYTITLENNGEIDFDEPSHFNTGILILEGDIRINDKDCKNGDFILFENNPGNIKLQSITKNSMAIILSGQPINEPIATGGPFVMNTREEIISLHDFQIGRAPGGERG